MNIFTKINTNKIIKILFSTKLYLQQKKNNRMPRDSISSYYHDQHHNHHRSAHYVRGGSPSRDHNSRHSPFSDQRHGYSGRRGETGDRRRIATPPLPSNSYQSSEAENHRTHYANERSRSRTPRGKLHR